MTTYRNRKLLDISHEAPCFLLLSPACGNHPSVPCHSDMLEHGRGVGHKSEDCLAIPGCPSCHALFTRENLGREGYFMTWARAFAAYVIWQWKNGKVRCS